MASLKDRFQDPGFPSSWAAKVGCWILKALLFPLPLRIGWRLSLMREGRGPRTINLFAGPWLGATNRVVLHQILDEKDWSFWIGNLFQILDAGKAKPSLGKDEKRKRKEQLREVAEGRYGYKMPSLREALQILATIRWTQPRSGARGKMHSAQIGQKTNTWPGPGGLKRLFMGLLGLAMIVWASGAAAAADGRFRLSALKLKGEITNFVVEDMDGDGLKDLVVFHADTSIRTPQRWVTVLWQDKATGFDPKRVYELQPGPEAAAMDIGQADGKEGLDLIAICPSGVVYYPNSEQSFGPQTLLLQKETALAMPSPRTLPYIDWLRDWNGDGHDDLLLFQFGQSLLFTGDKNGPDPNKPQTLAIKPWSDLLAASGVKGDAASQQDLVSMNSYLPRVYARDWNGDGRLDLIAVGRKDITVFIQDEKGIYQASLVRKYEVELFTPAEERFSASPYYPYYPPSLSFADLDHDGKADLVGQQLIGLLGKMKSKVVLYWGRTGSLSRGKPDVVFTPKNLAVMALVADVNKDGLEDILIPTLGLNFFSVGRVFATGTFPVEINYYLQTREHKFLNTPDYIRSVNLVFDLEKFRLAAGIPGVFDDFNGDGFPDAAIGKSKTQLEVIICDKNGKYASVRESISVPVSSMIMVQDLNGDDMADIILNYFDDPDHRGELRILMNRGNW